MKKIDSILHTTASEELEKETKEEIKVEDPDKEVTIAELSDRRRIIRDS